LPSDLNDDVFDVKMELIPVAARWRDVGIALRVTSDKLDNIETMWSNNLSRCLELMVTEWLKRNYNVGKFGEPTWQKLVEAVNSPAGGANTALARDIAGRHKAAGTSSGCNILCMVARLGCGCWVMVAMLMVCS